jgi:hypothetical protein
MPLLLAVAWLPLWYVVSARTQVQMTGAERSSNELWRSAYFRTTSMNARTAKEIRLFGLQEWMLGKFDSHHDLGARSMWHGRGFVRWAFLPGLLAPAAVSGIILAVAHRGRGLWTIVSTRSDAYDAISYRRAAYWQIDGVVDAEFLWRRCRSRWNGSGRCGRTTAGHAEGSPCN